MNVIPLLRPEQLAPMRTGRARSFLDGTRDPAVCWEWDGAMSWDGYGRTVVRVDGHKRTKPAHRVVYVLAGNEIPEGLMLDHLCRNRRCVNPAHLEPVTASVNTLRSDHAKRRRTHCPGGHPLEGDNLIPSNLRNGRRACLTCHRERRRARRAAAS